MEKINRGIHHITSIVGNVEENVNFYKDILGLRLVKKTVNYDDPGTYHLYFGDKKGSPGTIITFFPYDNAREGKIGNGQVGITTYAIPKGSMEFWQNRFNKLNINYKKSNRFNEDYLEFEDYHGLKLELVEREEGKDSDWSRGGINPDVAIKGFGGAVLCSHYPNKTANTMENLLGFERVGEEGDCIRFKSSSDIGNIIDVKTISMGKAVTSIGTVHHIAWRAENEYDLLEWQNLAREQGYAVTEVKDRNYFKSIYFSEKGGILFEIATDVPGFTIDEDVYSLGKELMLPPQYEEMRLKLEKSLTPINIGDKK